MAVCAPKTKIASTTLVRLRPALLVAVRSTLEFVASGTPSQSLSPPAACCKSMRSEAERGE